MTGVAYIHSCTPKVIRNRKSRYFVVMEDIIIPKPKPKHPSMIIRTGTSSRAALIWKSIPDAK